MGGEWGKKGKERMKEAVIMCSSYKSFFELNGGKGGEESGVN